MDSTLDLESVSLGSFLFALFFHLDDVNMNQLVNHNCCITTNEWPRPVDEEVLERGATMATVRMAGSHGWVEIHARHINTCGEKCCIE